jgi:hypothetical protein
MRRHPVVLALIVTTLAATGCSMGPKVDHFAPAHQAAGAQVRLKLGRGVTPAAITGELLAVGDSDLLVLDTAQVWRVPLRLVSRGTVPERGSDVAIERGRLGDRGRSRLRLLSRYPQGLADERLSALLRAYGRDSVVAVR